MKLPHRFSFQRLRGIIAKEFTQMRRDRLTFAMMLGIPLIQLTLFGYAINSDPRHLPTAVLLADQGAQGRTLLRVNVNAPMGTPSRDRGTPSIVRHPPSRCCSG